MPATAQQVLDDHHRIRRNLLGLLDAFSVAQLGEIPPFLNNNLLWNAGHIVAVQELLTFALGGHRSPSGKEFIGRYRGGTRPFSGMEEEWPFIRAQLAEGNQVLRDAYTDRDWSGFQPFTTQLGIEVRSIDHALIFNNLHETLHLGTMLAIRKWVVANGGSGKEVPVE
ncbi:DinB family protein [Neolewinella xylanilytica]|uniref:DinB family protein n=1 Tax=Neolewinella xylanilytica TaxID=1514080 RepID=A0A2S6IA91_9BACT|nr:DinB family protein [Neolewinella xylanilytica]PPK88408.1 DinB family protein [Neolewinella xylanilytica]